MSSDSVDPLTVVPAVDFQALDDRADTTALDVRDWPQLGHTDAERAAAGLARAGGMSMDEARRATEAAIRSFNLADVHHLPTRQHGREAMRNAVEWELAATQVAALTGRPLDAARRALTEFAKTAGATPAGAVAETRRMLEHAREAQMAAALNARAAARQVAAARPTIPPSAPPVANVRQRRAKRKQAKASRRQNRNR